MNIFPRSDVMDMAEEIPSSGLHWEGAPAEQLTFMRGVYDRHVAQAGRRRQFVADVPDAELGVVEGRYKLRTPAAASCRALLEEARAELARQRALGISQAQQVRYVRVNSAYRSASEQFRIWQNAFPRHFRATQEARQALPGGGLGDQAVNYLARYIGQRIAAPGYSLHNNGLAVDFGTHEGGLTLGANSQGIAHWRRSWFYHWLTENAARFGFYENRAIDEPWHWEYRQPAQPRTEALNAHSRASLPPHDGPGSDGLAQYAEHGIDQSRRDYIRWIQTSLNQLIAAGLEVDGIMGWHTREAIRAFQARHGLTVDGIVGPRTEAALIAAGTLPPPGLQAEPTTPAVRPPSTPATGQITSSNVTPEFIASIQNVEFRNSAEINVYFNQARGVDFVDWFNREIAGRANWRNRSIGHSPEVKDRFNRIWDCIPAMFGTPTINLIQFVCLISIMINETAGQLSPITERVGKPGHPKIAYAFDRIRPNKRSYNTSPHNRTAYELFNDPDFIAAHGDLPFGVQLRNTTDRRWAGDRYPQEDYPTSTDPRVTGFILEADFYKFRGRGLIQTTFRSAYKRIINYVQTNQHTNPIIARYRERWSGRNLDYVATTSGNNDWNCLFQETDFIIATVAIRLHSIQSGNYLNLPLNATNLNGTGQGSIYYVGFRVSGGRNYADLFRSRVLQILTFLDNW